MTADQTPASPDEAREPRTETRETLLDRIRRETREAVKEGDADDCSSPDCIADAVYEIVRVALPRIEAEERTATLQAVMERVEVLIVEAGGRCRVPADLEDPICETHSELLFDGACEDQPWQLLWVILALSAEGARDDE